MRIGAAATLMVATATLIGSAAAPRAQTFTGSGIVIGTKGEILTNAHVVEACQKITVKLTSENSQLSTLVARDEQNDLAVIRLTGTNNPPTSVAVFRESPPVRAGDAVVALGYPLSGVLATEANVSVGNVSALSGIADDSRYLQISAPVQEGNSGGPLLDGSGHLVGIVTGKLNAVTIARFTGDIPQNVNFALKSEVARTFLDSKRIEYQTARSRYQLSPADVGDMGRPFTVYIECEQVGTSLAAASPTVSPPVPSGGKGSKEQQITGPGSRDAPAGLAGGQPGSSWEDFGPGKSLPPPRREAARQSAPSSPNKKTEYVPRWGMQLTANWSERKAWETYRMIQKQYAALLGDLKPIVVRSRGIGLGFAMRYNIRIADDDRDYLEKLCQKLIESGGACWVLRNDRG
jgi:hypothetical protein